MNKYFQIALIVLTLLNCFILYFLSKKKDKPEQKIEVKVSLSKPVTHNYSITKPILLKETIITTSNLSKNDSDLIVRDYLMKRVYSDSLSNDTFKLKYDAIVEKNSLKNINFKYTYKPMLIEKTITNNTISNCFNIGGVIGYNNGIDIGLIGGVELKKYSIGIIYQPITNRKGGFIYLTRRIKYN